MLCTASDAQDIIKTLKDSSGLKGKIQLSAGGFYFYDRSTTDHAPAGVPDSSFKTYWNSHLSGAWFFKPKVAAGIFAEYNSYRNIVESTTSCISQNGAMGEPGFFKTTKVKRTLIGLFISGYAPLSSKWMVSGRLAVSAVYKDYSYFIDYPAFACYYETDKVLTSKEVSAGLRLSASIERKLGKKSSIGLLVDPGNILFEKNTGLTFDPNNIHLVFYRWF